MTCPWRWLWCDTIQSGRLLWTFRRNLLFPFSELTSNPFHLEDGNTFNALQRTQCLTTLTTAPHGFPQSPQENSRLVRAKLSHEWHIPIHSTLCNGSSSVANTALGVTVTCNAISGLLIRFVLFLACVSFASCHHGGTAHRMAGMCQVPLSLDCTDRQSLTFRQYGILLPGWECHDAKRRLRQPPQRCVDDQSPDCACVIGSDLRYSDYYDNIDGACSTHGGDEKCISAENPEGRSLVERLYVLECNKMDLRTGYFEYNSWRHTFLLRRLEVLQMC